MKTHQVKGLTLSLALCFATGSLPTKAAALADQDPTDKSLTVIDKAVAVSSRAAIALDIEPEIIASSWSDNANHFASVTFNGKELFRFKMAVSTAQANDTAIDGKAEDLAAKFDQLVKNKKFNPDKLYPIKTKDGVVLKTEGTELLKLSNTELANSIILGQAAFVDSAEVDAKTLEAKSLECGLKLTNVIRTAFGVKALPVSFLKLAEFTARHSFDDLTAIAKATGHFSGNASWYGPHFHGHKTSDGTIFNQDGLTAAHRSLPFGTKLLVTNRRTGDSCVVKVNDRGPFIGGRVIDLSKGAARQLNMLGSGVAMVDCIVLGRD